MEKVFLVSKFKGNSLFLNALKSGIKDGRIDDAVNMVVSQSVDNRRLVCEMVGIENLKNCLKYYINKRLVFHEHKKPH